MINQNDEKNNTADQTEGNFINALQELGIAGLLRKSNIFKEKGHSVFPVFQTLLLMVFRGCSLYEFLRSEKGKSAYDDTINEAMLRYYDEGHHYIDRRTTMGILGLGVIRCENARIDII